MASAGSAVAEERARIGTAGELALVDLLTAAVEARVEHVAALSDGYGYDVSVQALRHCAHLEVKTTLRRSRLTV